MDDLSLQSKRIREGVEHIGICVVYLCHDGKGNFAMLKRGKLARDEQGAWENGGGALELHESVTDGLKREIYEEYGGAKVLTYNFLGYRDIHRMQNRIRTHWLGLDFKVLVDRNTVKIGEPHKFDDMGWFSLSNLPSPLHPQLPGFLILHRKKLLSVVGHEYPKSIYDAYERVKTSLSIP